MSFVAITHLWLRTSCCWNVAGHKEFITLWKVLSDFLIHLVHNCYSDFKVAFFILHPFLYNPKISTPALVGCIVQIKLADKQILQVCITCRVALWRQIWWITKTSDMPDKLGCTHSVNCLNAFSGKISTQKLYLEDHHHHVVGSHCKKIFKRGRISGSHHPLAQSNYQ